MVPDEDKMRIRPSFFKQNRPLTSDSDGLAMHLILGMAGQGIRDFIPDPESVAAIEAHRRLVFHEDPGMERASLLLGLLQQGMADPAPLTVGSHEEGGQIVIHQSHEAEQLAALLEHPDAGVVELAGTQLLLSLPPAGSVNEIMGLQGCQQPDLDDLFHVFRPARSQHIRILVNNLNTRSLGEFDDETGGQDEAM